MVPARPRRERGPNVIARAGSPARDATWPATLAAGHAMAVWPSRWHGLGRGMGGSAAVVAVAQAGHVRVPVVERAKRVALVEPVVELVEVRQAEPVRGQA